MLHPIRRTGRLAVLVLAATTAPAATHALNAAPSALEARAQEKPPATCCFTRPGYSGTCEVEPGKDETCSGILAYLNNPLSQGKSYCGNTTLRGGWKSASCEAPR